jgi:hypothetical protein
MDSEYDVVIIGGAFWWKCELINLRLMLAARAAVPASEASATARTETVQA